MCHRDFASKVIRGLIFTDWGPDSGWVKTIYTHEHYIAETAESERPELAKAPGWRRERTRADTMHCTNLGLNWYQIGNSLFYLAHVRAPLMLEGASK